MIRRAQRRSRMALQRHRRPVLDGHERGGTLRRTLGTGAQRQSSGSMQVKILRRRYSSSRKPYARRWMTRILLFSPSTNPKLGVTLADRDFIDADHFGSGSAGTRQLSCHVLLIERLDRIPIEAELLGQILDCRLAAAPVNKVGKSFCVKRVVGQKLEPLTFHFATGPAKNASRFEFEKNPHVAAGEVAHAANPA